MSGEHSILSPSSAHRRVRCVGSLAACKGIPNPSSEYAAEGTAYHEVASKALTATLKTQCEDYIGMVVEVDGFKFTIDADNAAHAQVYVDAIRRIPGTLCVEVRLDTSPVVGVPGQGGTGDAIVLDYEHGIIHVNDLKFGRGEVVFAEDNEQMMEYGGAALEKYQDLANWKYVRLAIHQPRVNHYDEVTYTVEELRAKLAVMAPLEQNAFFLYENGTPAQIRAALTPGDKQCRWCPIKGSCAARAEAMMAQFPVTPAEVNLKMTDAELAAALDRTDDIADWCSAVRSEALQRAKAGSKLPGWKMVVGRKGARKWDDEVLPEAIMWAEIGDKAYKPREIITASVAEKALKKHPETWTALQSCIVQADGAPSLERESDPRETLVITTLEFGLTSDQTGTV